MSVFEALMIMLTFGLLVIAIMKEKDTKKQPAPIRMGELVIFLLLKYNRQACRLFSGMCRREC